MVVASEVPAGPPPAHTLPARLASQIIDRARQLSLPAGTHLAEQDLANTFRVSRTPVRMALRALQDMDVVESRPNRGFFLKRAADELAEGAKAASRPHRMVPMKTRSTSRLPRTASPARWRSAVRKPNSHAAMVPRGRAYFGCSS